MSMAKAKKRSRNKGKPRAVSLPPAPWDMGPDTPAQRHMKIVESVEHIDPKTGKRSNPNNVKRARRVDMLEVYRKRGVIDARQFSAGEALRNAYEATQKSPPAIKQVQVDCSPKPDHAISVQTDRLSAYINLSRHIRPADEELIDAVVLNGSGIPGRLYKGRRHQIGLQHLRDALEHLANAANF